MNINQIISNYSKKAANYDAKATMQKDIAEKLSSYFPEQPCRNILDIGCGTGFLTKLLVDKYPEAKITGIDISPAMIDIASANVPHAEFINGSIYDMNDVQEPYDLIVTSSALHWMNDLPEFFAIVHNILHPGAIFLTAAFVDESLFELKESFRVAYEKSGIKKKKHVIDFPRSKDILSGMEAQFELLLQEKTVFFLYYPSAKLSIQGIKEVGGSYSYFYNQSFTERKTIFSNVFKYYESRFKETESSVVQSWEVMIVSARKPF